VGSEPETIRAVATVTLGAEAIENLGPETVDRLADLVADRLVLRGHDGLLSAAGAAAVADVSSSTIRRAIRAGGIEVFGYVGNRPRLRRSAVEEWVAAGRPHSRLGTGARSSRRAVARRTGSARVLGEVVRQLREDGERAA
jgi:excisionase family DNA binding protein